VAEARALRVDSAANRAGEARVAALDGLRGVAVLIVLASHFSNAGLLPSPGMSGTGKSGVYLFFVLSAFLLADRIFASHAGRLDHRAWLDYALRRVLRIWPLYLLVLLLSLALTRSGLPWHYAIDVPAFWRHLGLQEGQSVLWSIPVEFTFYLVLPPLALAGHWLLARRGGTVGFSVAMLVAVLAAHLAWPPGDSVVNDVRLGPYLPVFLCGVLAAGLWRRGDPTAARIAWMLAGVIAVAAFVVTIPAVWAVLSGGPFQGDLTHRWFIGFGVLWAALLLSVLRGPARYRAVFEWGPLRAMGWISYSVYLWHMPIIDIAKRLDVPGPARTAIAATAILAVGIVSYRLVERPLQRIRVPQRA
jgi:peptidoglycan/LPS O-acetylase OafA/YrhL